MKEFYNFMQVECLGYLWTTWSQSNDHDSQRQCSKTLQPNKYVTYEDDFLKTKRTPTTKVKRSCCDVVAGLDPATTLSLKRAVVFQNRNVFKHILLAL
jgi:hypothetical protein